MKIAIIDMDNLKNPFWAAGQARATREVGKRLAKKHDITVYCSKYPGYQDYVEDGITYKHIGICNHNSRITNIMYILTVPFVVRNIKADIILENFCAPISVCFSPLFTKIPVVGLPTMFNAKEFSQKYHLPLHWIEQFGFKFYKYLLPYSNIDSQKAKILNPKIILKIVPQGVGDEFFKIIHKIPKHILFLGRFDIAQKGIDLLLFAYSKISDKIKLPLVIAGHGPDEGKIKKLVKQLAIENKVHFVGSAYGEKKFKLMSEALYVAFPSRHDELSLWSLEALAGGLPLVEFNLPEYEWADANVVFKAKPFDINAYSKLLLKASNIKLISKMRKDCRKFARKFTWEKVTNEFESFFFYVLELEGKKNNE